MSFRDPIVEELRAVRDAIAKELGYDIERLGRAMQEKQAHNDRPVVRLPPKRLTLEKKTG